MQIIKSPWKDLFLKLVSSSEKSIKFTVPYIKRNIVDDIYNIKKSSTTLSLITSFKLMNFYTGASDLTALEHILNGNGEVKNYQKLHSKIYIFDEKSVIISSGNLTNNGLTHNYEYGIFINEEHIISEVINDFNLLLNDEEIGQITLNEVTLANNIITKIPKTKPIILPDIDTLNSDYDNDIYTGGIDTIESSLTGWKLEIFRCLLEVETNVFTLDRIYQNESSFVEKFPKNQNIKAKIRQTLQYLRDFGLVEFLGKGKYKKLWI